MNELIQQLKLLIADHCNKLKAETNTHYAANYRGRIDAYDNILRIAEAIESQPEPIQNETSLVVRIMKLLEFKAEQTERQQSLSNCCRGRYMQAAETLLLVNELVATTQKEPEPTNPISVGIIEQLEKRIAQLTDWANETSDPLQLMRYHSRLNELQNILSIIQQTGRAVRPDNKLPASITEDLAKMVPVKKEFDDSVIDELKRQVAVMEARKDAKYNSRDYDNYHFYRGREYQAEATLQTIDKFKATEPTDTKQPSNLAKIITERIATLEWSDTNYDREIAELKLILDLLKQHPYHKSMLEQRLAALCDGAKTVVHPELKKEYKYRIAEVSFLLDATE